MCARINCLRNKRKGSERELFHPETMIDRVLEAAWSHFIEKVLSGFSLL